MRFRATFGTSWGMVCATLAAFPISAAVAAPPVDRLFERFYGSDEVEPRFCGRNVDGFFEFLARENALPDDLRRVTIRTERSAWHMEDMLIALNAREATPRAGEPALAFYRFHVVAVRRGRVYDFSFGHEPRALPLEEYLEAMFVPAEPYPIFGKGFRIRGMGPDYAPDHARAEIAGYSFAVEKRSGPGRFALEAEYADAASFIAAFGR